MNEHIFDGLDIGTFVKTSCKYTKNIDDSEDCTQQALLTAWERRGDIGGDVESFLKNLIQKKKKQTQNSKRNPKQSQYAKSAEYLLQLQEFSQKAERIIKALTSVQRKTLEYRLLDYSIGRIAELMDVSTGTVLSRLFYIRKKLQSELGEYADLVD